MQKENSFFFSFSNESTFDRGQRYFRFQVLMVQGFLNKGTGLYGQGAYDGGDDGADDLQHLEYFLPIDFHFTQIKLFKKVTQKSRKSQKLCNFASKIYML